MKYIIHLNKYYFLLFFFISNLYQAQYQADSLEKIIDKNINDTNFVNASIKLSDFYLYKNLDKSLSTLENCLSTSLSLKHKVPLIYYSLAYLYCENSNYKKSLEYYQLAEFYSYKNNLHKFEEFKARIEEGKSNVYERINNLEASISSQKKAINLYKTISDTLGVIISHLNLGRLLNINNDFLNARNTYSLGINLIKSKRDSLFIHNAFTGIGTTYFNEKNYNSAISYYSLAELYRNRLDPENIVAKAAILSNLSESNFELGNYTKSIGEGEKSLEIYKQALSIRDVNNCYRLLAKAYAKNNQPQQSSAYYEKFVSLNDSLEKENNAELLHDMSIKYETEKKEKENQVLTLENKNKSQIIYFALGGCALLFGLVFFIYRGYRNKQKANTLLAEKNSIISHQKEIVEEQHQEITDSIKYAQRIQGAILPPRNLWQQILPDSFVLYMPKDVLSGDFYWIEETKDYIYVAAADCTGHGVPGALISIVNFNLLNKAVLEQNLVTPSEILDAVNSWLTVSLHQTYRESAVRDGMDVSLIAIHKHSNEVLFAGANNPIYIVSKGELKQIKGDKFPVGAFIEDQIQKFTTKSFKVNKGDCIYLFSDGFADQFGGDNGKKYKYAPFQQKLITISEQNLTEQRQVMKQEFLNWKGKHEQVDDVLLIGIKIS